MDEDIELETTSTSKAGNEEKVPLAGRLATSHYRIPARSEYKNFASIDWTLDKFIEKHRRNELDEDKSLKGRFLRHWDSFESWIVMAGAGIITGFLVGLIDISTEWLSDIKRGGCSSGFWVNQVVCCWDSVDPHSCPNWKTWSQAFGIDNSVVDGLIYVLFGVLFAFLSALFVKVYSPLAAGSAIPEIKVIAGGFVIKKILGFQTLVIKSVGLVLSVASGMAVGKDAPFVHIAACCGNIFTRLFDKYDKNEIKKREVFTAATAAGVACAFGAPLGGVLLAYEEIAYYFSKKIMIRAFVCSLFAIATLELINPFRNSKLVLFQTYYDSSRSWYVIELLPFAIIGVIGGLVGGLFVKLNMYVAKWRKDTFIKNWPIAEVCVIALLSCLIQYPLVLTRISTEELISDLFAECDEGNAFGICDKNNWTKTIGYLMAVFVIKFVLVTITVGSRVPSGLLIPGIIVGATYGRVIGIVMQMIYDTTDGETIISYFCKPGSVCITPAIYAIMGSTAVIGGVTRTAVSFTILMVEVSGAVRFLLPMMMVSLISKYVANFVHTKGFYDVQIELRGLPYLDPDKSYRKNYVASQLMTSVESGLVMITTIGNTIYTLKELLKETSFQGFPIIHSIDDRTILGYIHRVDLQQAVSLALRDGFSNNSTCHFAEIEPIDDGAPVVDMRPFMDLTPIVVNEKQPVEVVLDLFRKLGIRYVLVENRGQLSGIITRKNVLRHLATLENRNLSDLKF